MKKKIKIVDKMPERVKTRMLRLVPKYMWLKLRRRKKQRRRGRLQIQ